jgi:hypothetical protein
MATAVAALSSQHPLPPCPSATVLQLISALSSTENHDLHVQAIRARDEALSISIESYNHLCLELTYVLVNSDQPAALNQRLLPAVWEAWQRTDPTAVFRLQQDASLWIPLGKMSD